MQTSYIYKWSIVQKFEENHYQQRESFLLYVFINRVVLLYLCILQWWQVWCGFCALHFFVGLYVFQNYTDVIVAENVMPIKSRGSNLGALSLDNVSETVRKIRNSTEATRKEISKTLNMFFVKDIKATICWIVFSKSVFGIERKCYI